MTHWSSTTTAFDASWPAPDITPVLAFAAAAPSVDSAWQSCLSAILDANGGVDFVPIASGRIPCLAKGSGAIVTQSLSVLTAPNAPQEAAP